MWVVKLVVLLLILLVLYLLECVFDPWTSCGREACEGGRIYTEDHRYWHDCWRCKGTGKRRRFGRWVMDKVKEARRG